MSDTPDYTQWPTRADAVKRLKAAGLAVRAWDESQSVIDAIGTEVAQRTKRQFVADTQDTTRIYDGNGTAELEVDEMVSFTSAVVVGLQANPGYTLGDVLLVYEQNKPQTRLVVGRGSLPAYMTEAVQVPIPFYFPAGRQNIQITGMFGYAATIPFDLWEAANEEGAHRLAKEALFDPKGRIVKNQQGDVMKQYALNDADAIGWHERFEAKVKLYTRSSGKRLRNLRPRMI